MMKSVHNLSNKMQLCPRDVVRGLHECILSVLVVSFSIRSMCAMWDALNVWPVTMQTLKFCRLNASVHYYSSTHLDLEAGF